MAKEMGLRCHLCVVVAALALSSVKAKSAAEVAAVITPAKIGRQLVRFSLPLPEGFLRDGQTLKVHAGSLKRRVGIRVLDYYPAVNTRTARTAMVTFPYEFKVASPIQFAFAAVKAGKEKPLQVELKWDHGGVTLRSLRVGGLHLSGALLAPTRDSVEPAHIETVEWNGDYFWARIRIPDVRWPREVEVRADSLGQIVLIAHLQRMTPDALRAPEFGWAVAITGLGGDAKESSADVLTPFNEGRSGRIVFGGGKWAVDFPQAPLRRCGSSESKDYAGSFGLQYRAYRAEDSVPMQMASWRRAEMVIAPADAAPLTPALTEPHRVVVQAANVATHAPLEGLPELARLAPGERKLRDVVQAVADFLAESQDPVGGWRYPHPRSTSVIMSQAMEHAWQLVQADRLLGPQPKHLDAIERVLRQRILGWNRTGNVFSGLGGRERASGKVKTSADLATLYKRPSDRDFARDYTEGSPSFGSSPQKGIVYFQEVLEFYLQHRTASRLFAPPSAEQPLRMALARTTRR